MNLDKHIGKNYKEVKSDLPKSTIEKPKMILNKKIKVAKFSKEDRNVYLRLRIEYHDRSNVCIFNSDNKILRFGNPKKDVLGNEVFKFYSLSITAQIGQGREMSFGNLFEELRKLDNDEDKFYINIDKFRRVCQIKDYWHLNDMRFGYHEFRLEVIPDYIFKELSNIFDFDLSLIKKGE